MKVRMAMRGGVGLNVKLHNKQYIVVHTTHASSSMGSTTHALTSGGLVYTLHTRLTWRGKRDSRQRRLILYMYAH